MVYKIIEALILGDISAVRDFLSRENDVNLEFSDYNMTVLQFAVQGSQPQIVQCLLDEGADVNLKNRDGKTAIQLISHDLKPNSDAEAVLKILITAGADINSHSHTCCSKSILHLAVLNGNLELVKYLMPREANINARDGKNRTPLHYVFGEYFNFDLLKMLLSAGADVNAEDDDGETPLYSLMRTVIIPRKISNLDDNISDIFDLFLKYKANFTHVNNEDLTPLDVALMLPKNKKRITAIVKALILQCGFSVDTECDKTSYLGQSILHIVSWNDNKPLVKFLLENGAYIDNLDNLGFTPLAAAVYAAQGRSNLNVIKYLLKHNPNVNTITDFGCNILDCTLHRDSTKSRSWKMIIEHLAKRETTGHPLPASIKKTIEKHPKYSCCLIYSAKELERLKNHKLSSKHWLTLYNFLVDHKKKLVSYVQNPIVVEELQNIIDTIEQKYQRYGAEIKERFVKAMKNKDIVNRSSVVLSMLLSSHLSCINVNPDHIVIKKILDYCEFKHLNTFCNAFTNLIM